MGFTLLDPTYHFSATDVSLILKNNGNTLQPLGLMPGFLLAMVIVSPINAVVVEGLPFPGFVGLVGLVLGFKICSELPFLLQAVKNIKQTRLRFFSVITLIWSIPLYRH
ncbi:MAG: hypothetical protein JWR38_112 [Mucilaginibacter sp.]|nr:hypothetical protein [Mucilaginibacter sp.]